MKTNFKKKLGYQYIYQANQTLFFLCCSSTVFCLYPSPPPSPPPQPSPPPSSVSTPTCYCPCVIQNCSCKPFTLFSHYPLPSPLWSLSACSQFQCLLLYFAYLFVLLIRFQLKIRSYLSFTAWLISLSTMLSSSTCADEKGRSPFFGRQVFFEVVAGV